MQIPHFFKNVRWDLFEENVIGYLLDKMNFSNDLLNKIQWKNFLQILLENCTTTVKENTEIPNPASNPKLMGYYRGLFVDKEKFCKFAGEDEIFKALLRTINMGSEGVKVVDQFK